MSVWLTIPSGRPSEEANKALRLWSAKTYKIALWRDSDIDVPICDLLLSGPYPGYARAVNALTKAVMEVDFRADWMVAGGDDTLPDPNHSPEEIARQCSEHFGFYFMSCENYEHAERLGLSLPRMAETFGVMQPTGDRWAGGSIDRICGSPWMGREFCKRMYQGKGPLFEDYGHMFEDSELQEVALRLGVLWQRRDLVHMHNHFSRVPDGVNYSATPPPHLVKWNTQQHWDESKALFESRKAAGFPGHEPLGVKALAVA